MVWRAGPRTPGWWSYLSLPILYEQYLGFPPDFSSRETWGISEVCPSNWIFVWRINRFDGRSGLEDFIQNLGMGDGWRGAYSERL